MLIIAKGKEMVSLFAKALNATHQGLPAMGAKIAPSKSHNFASTKRASRWLKNIWWSSIEANIEVVKDFRHLGAHLTSGTTTRSQTICKRWEKTMKQLRRLKFCLATAEAKAKAIVVKVYAVAFYGIEAAEITIAKVAQLTAAVIDVFRTRNDTHNVDWFFFAFLGDNKEMDPNAQILTRRAMQIRRSTCKKVETTGQFQRILPDTLRHVGSNHQYGTMMTQLAKAGHLKDSRSRNHTHTPKDMRRIGMRTSKQRGQPAYELQLYVGTVWL